MLCTAGLFINIILQKNVLICTASEYNEIKLPYISKIPCVKTAGYLHFDRAFQLFDAKPVRAYVKIHLMNISEYDRLKRELEYLRDRFNLLISDMDVMLKRRGFRVFSKNPEEQVLFRTHEQRNLAYQYMKRYAFRIFLRDVIKHKSGFEIKDVAHYASYNMTKRYIEFLLRLCILEQVGNRYRLLCQVRSFGDTLVWFVTEVLKREFYMETLWGVKFRGRSVGGDYDILSNLTPGICFIEVKSSPPRQVQSVEVRAFLERVKDLCPDLSIFMLDTHLRMKDRIVALFEDVIKDTLSYRPAIIRLKRELFYIEDTTIYIINSKPGIMNNLEDVFSHFYRRRCLR